MKKLKSEFRFSLHALLVLAMLAGCARLSTLGLFMINSTSTPLLGFFMTILSLILSLFICVWYMFTIRDWFQSKDFLAKKGVSVSFFKCYGLSPDKVKNFVTGYIGEYGTSEVLEGSGRTILDVRRELSHKYTEM